MPKTIKEILKKYAIKTNRDSCVLDIEACPVKEVSDELLYSQSEVDKLKKELNDTLSYFEYSWGNKPKKDIDAVFAKFSQLDNTKECLRTNEHFCNMFHSRSSPETPVVESNTPKGKVEGRDVNNVKGDL